jgi:hypothetical protein
MYDSKRVNGSLFFEQITGLERVAEECEESLRPEVGGRL